MTIVIYTYFQRKTEIVIHNLPNLKELEHDANTGVAVAKYQDGTEHTLPIVEMGPKNTGVRQAHVFHLQEDLKIPEIVCSRSTEGCNGPATAVYTGRVLCLKSGHDISIISPADCRLGGAFPRIVSMGDDTASPAIVWHQGI